MVKTIWQPGEQVFIRARIGPVWSLVMPSTVVQDDPQHLILYVADGTPCRRLVLPDGSNLPRVLSLDQIAALPTELDDSTWSQTHLLHVTPSGCGYSVYMRWSAPEWAFFGWYVNMQTPLRRINNAAGVECEDLFLDIVVVPTSAGVGKTRTNWPGPLRSDDWVPIRQRQFGPKPSASQHRSRAAHGRSRRRSRCGGPIRSGRSRNYSQVGIGHDRLSWDSKGVLARRSAAAPVSWCQRSFSGTFIKLQGTANKPALAGWWSDRAESDIFTRSRSKI